MLRKALFLAGLKPRPDESVDAAYYADGARCCDGFLVTPILLIPRLEATPAIVLL
jgi:hypothetical protein